MMKRFYDKVVIGCCFFFVFVNVGIASTAFSVHQPYLVAMEGIGDTGGSLILSARTLVSLLAMLVVDRYYHALDVRIGVSVACLLTCAGFLVYSASDSLPVFFGGAVLLGLGYGLGGMVAMTYLANRWFSSGVGTVVGIAAMGSGLASIVVPLVVVRIIEASSLSSAFVVEACLAGAIGVLVFALLRNRPSDLGMEPFARGGGSAERRKRGDEAEVGAEDAGSGSPAAAALPSPSRDSATLPSRDSSASPSPRAAVRAAASVPAGERAALMAAMVGVGVFSCCGITYLSVLATSSGFTPVFGATLVSVAGIALTLAKFAAGELFDHLGAPRGSAIMFTLGVVGFALCCLAGLGNAPLMIAGAILVGCGLSLGSVGVSVWSIDLSAPEARSRQIKNFQVAYALGGFIANTLPGIVKDLVGTYVVSYAAAGVVVVAVAVVVLRFYRRFT